MAADHPLFAGLRFRRHNSTPTRLASDADWSR
jgi:hypothetical protein